MKVMSWIFVSLGNRVKFIYLFIYSIITIIDKIQKFIENNHHSFHN